MSHFQQASRRKLRFETSRGTLTTEDLWDLPLTSTTGKACLDEIERGLRRQVKDSLGEESMIKPAKVDDNLELAHEVVKAIITVRMAEADAASVKKANAEKRAKLLDLLEKKETEGLNGLSVEEIRAQLAAMD